MADIPKQHTVDVSDDVATKTTMDIDMHHADQTLKVLGETVLIQDRLAPEEDRRLLRKIDLCVLPILLFSYMFQYLDKSAMGYTAILGLLTDLHLHGQQYSWAGSLFNFGYLAASGPVALLMVRFPVGKFLSVSIMIWASILMCTAVTHNASGLWACRFFLGFMEAGVAPGFSIITAMWYKRSEQPLRHGAWYMGNVISGLFAGPLSYAMGHITGYPAWKVLFLIFGGVTLLWGILLFFILPDTPATAWFLTRDDRVKAVERVQDNMTGIKNQKWKREQMIEALRDPKVWLTVIIMLSANIPNGGVGNFASIVIQGFGFSTYNTLLVQMICTGFQAVFVGIACIGSSYLPNTRTIFMAIMMTIGLIGACMIRQINNHNIWARYMGYCLLSAYTSTFPLALSLNTANYGGFTKKTTVNAMVFVAYCIGNIIGPQLFFAREAPSYPSGFAAMLVCFSVGVIAIVTMRFYLIWENKRRDRRDAEIGEVQGEYRLSDAMLNLVDKTDMELLQFRYVY